MKGLDVQLVDDGVLYQSALLALLCTSEDIELTFVVKGPTRNRRSIHRAEQLA